MSTQIKSRRGTAAEHSTFTGAEAELTVNTTNDSVHVHDGTTAGGHELARADGSNLEMTTDLNFGDNDKAVFGAGSDLQIYHDGSNSFISDVGTGNLSIKGTNLALGDNGGTAYIFCTDNGTGGEVAVYHNGSEKLATTSTGVDVTGTIAADAANIAGAITADGLTVDGSASISSTAPTLSLFESDTTNLNSKIVGSGGALKVQTLGDGSAFLGNRFAIDHATGDISFYEDTGTTAKFFWDASAESLGIGTSSPDRALHVSSSTQAYPLRVQVTAGSTAGVEFIDPTTSTAPVVSSRGDAFTIETNNTERMRIDSSGSVGIGTSSPSYELDVQSSSGDAEVSITGSTTNNAVLKFENVTNGTLCDIYGNDSKNMIFRTNGVAEAMRIDSSGNLGIGTSSPSAPLTVLGATGGTPLVRADLDGNTVGDDTVANASVAIRTGLRDSGDYAPYVGVDSQGGSNGFYNGRLGVGFLSENGYSTLNRDSYHFLAEDSTYSATLDLLDPVAYIRGDGTYYTRSGTIRGKSALVFQTGVPTNNNGVDGASEAMRIDSNGNLLVGTTSFNGFYGGGKNFNVGDFSTTGATDGVTIETNGSEYVYRTSTTQTSNVILMDFYNPNGRVGSIVTSGSSTSYNTSSDYRLKEDWQPMVSNFGRVSALKPVNFAWKVDGSRVDGFLAHELQEVVPEAVTGTKDAMRTEEYEVTPAVLDDEGNVVTEAVMGEREVPDYQAIDQSKLVPLLTAALQDAIAEIETLKADVAQLKGTN